MDAGWTYGTVVAPATPAEPASVADGSAARILDEAEDFLNQVGEQVLAEVREEQAERARRRRGLRRFFRRDHG